MTLLVQLNSPHPAQMMPDPNCDENLEGVLSDMVDLEIFDVGIGDTVTTDLQDLHDLSGWNVLQTGQDTMASGGLASLDAYGSLDPISRFDDLSTLGVNLTAATGETLMNSKGAIMDGWPLLIASHVLPLLMHHWQQTLGCKELSNG